ncbi:hypothetical protein AVEN_273320-1 [Araneus ventricosus]|uniref:Uncharacterized protein n=1 Tax=Araneus ventricosus TaxID=182803 RepID=A0A4Y2LEM3_ARAVE|nr:hypothetical protein AVEN_273320-1 [Araneus ventricosus]
MVEALGQSVIPFRRTSKKCENLKVPGYFSPNSVSRAESVSDVGALEMYFPQDSVEKISSLMQSFISVTKSIYRCYRQFIETECLFKFKCGGQPGLSPENVERINSSFERSLRRLTYKPSKKIQIRQNNGFSNFQKRI